MKTFYAIVHKDRDSAFGVQFPDAPGCFSAADDLADVLPNAAEALSLYFDEAPPPEPSDLEAVRAAAAVDLRAGAFIVAVPLIERDSRVVRANISLDKGTLDAIDAAASARGLTRSAFLAEAARREIEGRHSAQTSAAATGTRHHHPSGPTCSSSARSHLLRVPLPNPAALQSRFERAHPARFRANLVNLNCSVTGHRPPSTSASLDPDARRATLAEARTATRPVRFAEAWYETPVYSRDHLPPAATLTGPAILKPMDATIILPAGRPPKPAPGWKSPKSRWGRVNEACVC